MYGINEITIEQLRALNDVQLSQLLHKLLELEVKQFNVQGASISVPLNTNSKDGGSDGKLEWTGSPARTKRFKNKYNLLQNKATDLMPSECDEEIMEKLKKGTTARKLKSEVNTAVDKKGSYILFTNRALTDQSKNARIAGFRKALKTVKKVNHASFNIEVFDGNFIKDWTNEFIAAVNFVQAANGIHRPSGFRSWKTVEKDIKADETQFQSNPVTEANMQAIQGSINNDKAIRIIGHSGIGKTRLIFETFRATDPTSTLLNHDFVYYDIGTSGDYQSLANFIISHREAQSGIIIVDNCDVETHLKLAPLVTAIGNIKVITMGYDDSNSITDRKIKLDRKNQKDIVKGIIEQRLGVTHNPDDIEYVARLSEGYPWMAVRFCEVITKTAMKGFDKELPEKFIEKLIFGIRSFNETEYKILRACSVFSAFGFIDDSFSNVINKNFRDSLQAQMDFIRNKVCDENPTETKFKETCERFKREDIIEQRGTYYIVKPTVLAIHLAAEWLRFTPKAHIKKIIENLKGVQLDTQFMQRLTEIDQLDKAKEIVEEFWGQNSPFGSAEVLKTEWGSLLFRFVVEVNPEVTVETLNNAFSNYSKSDLLKVQTGRRNIIWALEKLCFRKETFIDAAKFLFRLAVSENETWANNATGQITQLFQRFLAGTEANYQDRLEILDWALASNDPEFINLSISCMARTFIPQGQHHRSGGAESQGSGSRLIDFMPQTWQEIFDYWDGIIDRLLVIINGGGALGEYALKVLSRGIRTLASENAPEKIIVALEKVEKRSGQAWMDVRSELKKALRYDQNALAPHLMAINKILDEFEPKTIEEEFLANVILPEWAHEPPIHRNGQSIYKQQIDAEEFARKLIKEKTDWSAQIPALMKGEQRQGFNFGKIIGENEPKAKVITKTAIEEFGKIDRKEQNPGFLLGMIAGINDLEFYHELIEILLSNKELSWLALHVTKLYEFPLSQLMKLFSIVDQDGHPITVFDYFRYGKPLHYLKKEDVDLFVDKIASYGTDGITTAFSILFMQCFQDEQNWTRYGTKLRELMMRSNLMLSRLNNFESFYWGETAVKLLRGTKDVELAEVLSANLAEFAKHENFSYGYEHDAIGVLDVLLDEYFPQAWPKVASALESDYLTLQHIKGLIGTKNGTDGKEGILFKYPSYYQQIYDWAAGSDKGKIALANILPFAQQSEVEDSETGKLTKEVTIHDFAKGFIDSFGSDENILNELAANLGTFGTVGGSEWYFKLLVDLTGKLATHSNATVRNWAKKAVKYYEKSLAAERLENQNRQIW